MKKAVVPIVFLILTGLFSIPGLPKAYVRADGGSEAGTFDNAVNLYYNGKTHESADWFKRIAADRPEDDSARLNLIELMQETGDYQSAIAQLNTLIGSRPDNPGLYRANLLKDYVLSGQPGGAIQIPLPAKPAPQELYWLGLAYDDLGNGPRALKYLHASLEEQPFNPMACFALGRIYLSISDYADAQTYLKRALTQEPNLTAAYYPLALAYMAFGRFKPALPYLNNAVHFSPWDMSIAEARKNLLSDHPELVADLQETAQRKFAFSTPPVVEPAASRESVPGIRIGLAEKVQQFSIKTGDQFTLSAPDSPTEYTGHPSAVLNLSNSGEGLEIRDDAGLLIMKTSQSVTLAYRNPAAATILFDVELSPGSFWAGRADRAYRGILSFLARPAGVTIVNELNIEEYLYSVVPSEIPSTWPQESLKAQAVAARTYAIANLGRFNSRGFDLLSTADSQVYSGIGAERPETTMAVNATRGQILTYQGRPIQAFFSSNNGGFSESPKELWGFDIPYLRTAADPLLPPRNKPLSPYDLALWLNRRPNTYNSNPNFSAKSAYRWVQWVSREEIEYRLNLGERLGTILAVSPAGRTLSGRVYRVLIKGTHGETTLSGDAVRSELGGLRSSLFVVEPKLGTDGIPAFFIFTGGGWGHGIGLSQSGAAGMAADGFSAETILTDHYPGALINSIY